MNSSKLIFVYAGDSGAINTLIHVAHKIVSPKTYPCNLCGLMHNIVSEKEEWTRFMKDLSQPAEFLHRDEFNKQFPAVKAQLPTILLQKEGTLTVIVSSSEINDCKTTSELIQVIEDKLSGQSQSVVTLATK